MRRLLNPVIGLAVLAGVAVARQPLPMPPITPAVNVVPAAPIDRFLSDPRAYPEATGQAVYSVRAGGDWLAKMHQSDGRFHAGFNPSLRLWLDDDSDTREPRIICSMGIRDNSK